MRGGLYSLALALVTVAFVEAAAYWAGSVLQSRALLYRPQPVSEAEYDDYLNRRDALLGWPPSDGPELDGQGARVDPTAPAGPACVAAFGDSFTFGAEVEPEQAWPSQLARLLGCRVRNHGVSGYGTDQSYLRFTQRISELPQIVLLGHFQEGTLRNVNQFHALLNGGQGTGFKPRFLPDDEGGLELVPLPTLSYPEYRAAVEDPAAWLPHEYFVPGGPSGLQTFRFPFIWSVLASTGHFSIRARMAGVPRHAEFYDPAHSSRSLEITARLLQRFERETRRAGLEPLVLVLPAARDLEHHLEVGGWVFEPLMERLDMAGVRFLNLGPALVAHVAEAESRQLFEAGGHYSPFGNELVAGAVHVHLRELGLLR